MGGGAHACRSDEGGAGYNITTDFMIEGFAPVI